MLKPVMNTNTMIMSVTSALCFCIITHIVATTHLYAHMDEDG